MNSPLPPSSPPPVSSPISTPHRPHVNLVSSPGPMGPPLDEHEYDQLPFTLPPGPYSPSKPNASYAALVGQAILSSPERRLTLQEIYDWITIVHPYFKRGEQTWMNSIRHVLSTTVCFRKVTRDRTLGRTQWAIWDEDLECFQGGGFRKQLCRDFVNGTATKDKQSSRGKGKGRKREDLDDGGEDRKAKRSKTDQAGPLPALKASSSYTSATLSYPLFRPTRPTPHHQPYYESCLQSQPLPRDIIFPPLPTDVGYTRVPITSVIASTPASSLSSAASADKIEVDVTLESPPSLLPVELLPSSSSSSIPELTTSDSSSPSAPRELDSELIRSTTPKDNASRPHTPSIGSENSIRNSTAFRGIDVPHDSFLIPMKDGSLATYGHVPWPADEQEVGLHDDKEHHHLLVSKALNDTRKADNKASHVCPSFISSSRH
jgi:DNA ligase-4